MKKKPQPDFQKLYASGRRLENAHLRLYCSPSADLNGRVAFVTSKKLGNAVIRNKARRRLKEIYRLHLKSPLALDCVIVAKPGCAKQTFGQLENQLTGLMARLR